MPGSNSSYQRRPTTAADVFPIVRTCMAQALDVPEVLIEPTTAFFDELAATSFDVVDLLHRLDEATGAIGDTHDLRTLIRGDLAPDQFADASGRLTERGRAQVVELLPHRRAVTRQPQTPEDAVSSLTAWAIAMIVGRRVTAQEQAAHR
ncbi:acyl carrier protein [Flexivirga oryzae]|uniref:Acyl carrier protein n=1 Tax=Flexivirga oryzae TaxID=1794944 RepID=A0A839N667_9MICO|nr:phosphopantetheine-binding protein [Flexivirga oryzae]MBB2893240.1 acyl carrier protein [Flexivirga oryzae]